METELRLPTRTTKQREDGLTLLIDGGVPTGYFKDVISSHHECIDFVKFGWGTSIVTRDLLNKIDHLRQYDVKFFFGGTLFEKYVYFPRSLGAVRGED